MKLNRDVRKSYRALLNSYEWVEFSFAKIEKDGCCWACGEDDHSELQVHHLVYRDCLPWEYADHEVRVLCNDCHHGLHLVADLVWVELLRFQPHELEVILKRLKNSSEPNNDDFGGLCRGISGVDLKSALTLIGKTL